MTMSKGGLLAFLLGVLLAGAGAASGQSEGPAAKDPASKGPAPAGSGRGTAAGPRPAGKTLAQIYGDYQPDFLERERLSRNDPHKLSLQQWFYNMAQVEHDYRVDALIKKADELVREKDYRKAMALYQTVIGNFPNDLWRIEPNGIFIPSGLYCQRQLLRLPDDQILFYRTLHDPEAEEIFNRAKKYYSLLDFAELAERYLATSYGDDALWELGNAFLDQGNYVKALFYYRQIRDHCTLSDIPQDQLALRLGSCYKHLGMEKEYEAARDQFAGLTAVQVPGNSARFPTAAFLKDLAGVTVAKPPYFRQVRNPQYTSLGDYDLFPDLSVPIDRKEFVWSESFPLARRQIYARDLPWAAGNYVYYLHHNVLFCRSLLSGKLNWVFGPGGLVDWFDVDGPMTHSGYRMVFHPESDLLIHDDLVFASILKESPSLAAVDRITGQLRWSKGALEGAGDTDRNTRYLAPPAAGPNVVYAGYVYDDIEGKAHLTSRIGVNCFDSRTGRLLWQREICTLTPPKFSTSSRVRRIRIYGSSPMLKDGVVYHTTNAGVIVALDALSGTILWATRYPHREDLHDLLKDHQNLWPWMCRPPLLYEGRLYVMPVDSDLLVCLDPATGKVLWSRTKSALIPLGNRGDANTLVGVNPAGELVFTGGAGGLSGVDPQTGRPTWSRFGEPADVNKPLASGGVRGRALMTRSGKIYFSTFAGIQRADIRSEQYWDMVGKKTLAQRWYYATGTYSALQGYNERIRREATDKGEEPDPSQFLANDTDPFYNYHRFTFERYGTVFEMEVSPERVSMWYDVPGVIEASGRDSSPQGLFSQAELKEIVGNRKAAIELYSQGLASLPVWPTPFRTEINRQLFRLYNRQAEAAVRAGDLAGAEKFCYQMAGACTTSDDEIHTILAMAEVFRKQGRFSDSAACLTAAIRHYRDVKIALPAVIAGDTELLKAKSHALLKDFQDRSPRHFYPKDVQLAVHGLDTILDDYFSVISPLPAEVEVQTGQFATRLLQGLAQAAPDSFRQERESIADSVLSAESDEATILKLIAEHPGTQAAQKALDRLIERAATLSEPDRRIMLWRLNDAGRLNGLKVPAAVSDACNIAVRSVSPTPMAAGYEKATTTLDYDVNTLLVVLQPVGENAPNQPLGFIGTKSKRRYANKFGVVCWDLAANRKLWETSEIRLKDKGEEEGFTRYYVHDAAGATPKVIVHGWYDVLALSLKDGGLLWRFNVPYGFRIADSAAAEDVLVLADNSRSIAVHLKNGQFIWEANETGGAYSPPYLRDNLVVTVRRNPGGVAFRDLGTGRLLSHVQLSSLCEALGNPSVDWDVEAVPIGQAGNCLVITDGFDFICIDLEQRKIRWQKRITQIDRGGTEALPYRFWVNEQTLVVLKPDYDSQSLEGISLADGQTLWGINEAKTPGVPFSCVIGADAIYGLHHNKDDLTAVNVLAYTLSAAADSNLTVKREGGRRGGEVLPLPKRLYRQTDRNYQAPRSWLAGPLRGGRFIAQISDEQKRWLLVVNAADGTVCERAEVKGFGQWGGYGEVSCAVQGANLLLLSEKDLTVLTAKK